MKIKTKFSIYSTIWLTCILLISNTLIYFLFLKISTDSEIDVLQNKAGQMIESIGAAGLLTNNKENLIRPYLPENTLIRVVDPQSRIINQVFKDDRLVKLEPAFSTKSSWSLIAINDQPVLTVRTPISFNGKIVGTLEIAEALESIEESIKTLVSILIFSSIAAIIFSLLGSSLMAKIILRPISNVVTVMKDIQQSGVLKEIPVQYRTKDELYQMATTFNSMISRLKGQFLKQEQFVSDASHELKTPLTIIESYTNLLRRWGSQDPQMQVEALDAIYSETIRMKDMIGQLMDMVSLDKELELTGQDIELVSFCKKTAKSLSTAYKRDIITYSAKDEILLTADEQKLKQLLLILLDNALKYSKDRVEIHLEQNSEQTTIHVKDYGIGIPKEDIDHIFERFYRVDKSRHRQTGGTGLGLAIARVIVLKHNGSIEVNSEEEKGTEIIIHLPNDFI